MNDNETIKGYCKRKLCPPAQEIINRKDEEIERLTEAGKEAVSCFTRMETLYKIKCKELEIAKTEAIKEFAERLKAEYADFDELHEEIRYDNLILAIDNLVKEMTESVNYGSSKTEGNG